MQLFGDSGLDSDSSKKGIITPLLRGRQAGRQASRRPLRSVDAAAVAAAAAAADCRVCVDPKSVSWRSDPRRVSAPLFSPSLTLPHVMSHQHHLENTERNHDCSSSARVNEVGME